MQPRISRLFKFQLLENPNNLEILGFYPNNLKFLNCLSHSFWEHNYVIPWDNHFLMNMVGLQETLSPTKHNHFFEKVTFFLMKKNHFLGNMITFP
jgi:hypothetical protein